MKPHVCGSKKIIILKKYATIAALFYGAAILFSACVNDIEKIKAFSSLENLPSLEATNFESTFTDSGMVRFYLKTPELKRYETEGQAFIEFPQGILLIKYNQYQQIVSRITARYAKQFVIEKRWEARNNVIAVNATGDTLKTDHLIWDELGGKIYSDEYVRIVRPDQVITGIGFESDQSLENWRIKNPKGTIYIQLNRNGASPDSLSSSAPTLRPIDLGK